MGLWDKLDMLDRLFVIWAFLLQFILIIHFAIRKPLFKSYTVEYGWIVYALCIPGAVVSIFLLLGGKSWYFWIGGFLFMLYAAFGYWVDYIQRIPWRNPLQVRVMVPYVSLYLITIMFYWWPLLRLNLQLWLAFTVLYVIATILNITSH